MRETEDFQAYLQETGEPPPIHTEVPSSLPPRIQKLPNGYDPMERILLEGEAYRRLSSGGAPWWAIASEWIIFGLYAASIVVMAFLSDWLLLLIALPFAVVVVAILWRGTAAKLAAEREKAERQAKYQRGMRD